ncbi:hypothetical protein ACFE04_012193 [Oxalis oulophora]
MTNNNSRMKKKRVVLGELTDLYNGGVSVNPNLKDNNQPKVKAAAKAKRKNMESKSKLIVHLPYSWGLPRFPYLGAVNCDVENKGGQLKVEVANSGRRHGSFGMHAVLAELYIGEWANSYSYS